MGGPLLGGFLISGGFALDSIFYVLAGIAVVGAILTLVVPMARRQREALQGLDTAGSAVLHPQQIPAIVPPAA